MQYIVSPASPKDPATMPVRVTHPEDRNLGKVTAKLVLTKTFFGLTEVAKKVKEGLDETGFKPTETLGAGSETWAKRVEEAFRSTDTVVSMMVGFSSNLLALEDVMDVVREFPGKTLILLCLPKDIRSVKRLIPKDLKAKSKEEVIADHVDKIERPRAEIAQREAEIDRLLQESRGAAAAAPPSSYAAQAFLTVCTVKGVVYNRCDKSTDCREIVKGRNSLFFFNDNLVQWVDYLLGRNPGPGGGNAIVRGKSNAIGAPTGANGRGFTSLMQRVSVNGISVKVGEVLEAAMAVQIAFVLRRFLESGETQECHYSSAGGNKPMIGVAIFAPVDEVRERIAVNHLAVQRILGNKTRLGEFLYCAKKNPLARLISGHLETIRAYLG